MFLILLCLILLLWASHVGVVLSEPPEHGELASGYPTEDNDSTLLGSVNVHGFSERG